MMNSLRFVFIAVMQPPETLHIKLTQENFKFNT